MITRHSRYRFTFLFKDANHTFLGTRPLIDTTPSISDRFHPVVKGDRLDVLAFHYLGKADFWWVIADYNDLFNPLEKLTPGQVLRIPGGMP